MLNLRTVWKKKYSLPAEHGSWIWWIGPLLIGRAAAGQASSDGLWLTLAMFAAFLFRQPAGMLVKTFSARRPLSDRAPAMLWGAFYAAFALTAFAVLLKRGYLLLLYLTIPGVLVFGWHLWLVSRRAERGQRGIEIVGSGVLALAAPASYWVNGGAQGNLGWILWSLCWLQSAASIVFIYLRLEQRRWPEPGDINRRLSAGFRTLVYHLFNLTASIVFLFLAHLPALVVASFGLMFLDAVEGILRPAVGVRPARIGIRQLVMSSTFTLLCVLGYLAPTLS